MDKQYRLTKWEEWRVGDRYLWLKGGAVTMAGKCVSANREDAYVTFEMPSGKRVKTISWEGRYISLQHYCLAAKEEFGVGRITNMARLGRWVRSRMIRRKPWQMCYNCEFYDSSIMICFERHNIAAVNNMGILPEDWCQWWSKPGRSW